MAPKTAEHKAKISAALMGHVHTTETRAKISATMKGQQGHQQTEETRTKISQALKGRGRGRTLDAEHRRNMSLAHGGTGESTYSASHRRVSRLRGTPSYCVCCRRTDDGTRYEWANLTGNYEDPLDYLRLCRPCHLRLDAPSNPAEKVA